MSDYLVKIENDTATLLAVTQELASDMQELNTQLASDIEQL